MSGPHHPRPHSADDRLFCLLKQQQQQIGTLKPNPNASMVTLVLRDEMKPKLLDHHYLHLDQHQLKMVVLKLKEELLMTM